MRRQVMSDWQINHIKTKLKSGHWWDQFNQRYKWGQIKSFPPLPRSTRQAEWRLEYSRHRKKQWLIKWSNSYDAKQWAKQTMVCPKCSREVSNREYWSGKKGSSHFRAECRPEKFYLDKIPVQSWKRELPYPMPEMPDYSLSIYPQNMDEFRKWWGLDKMKLSKTKKGVE